MGGVTYDSEERVWKGPQINSIYNTNAGLGEIILFALAKTPNKVTQISHDQVKTYVTCTEMRRKSILVAENLKRMGYKLGDTLALVSRSTPNVASVVYGCFIIGAPIHCLSPTFDVDDLSHMFNLTKPKLVICEEMKLDTVAAALRLCKLEKTNVILIEKELASSEMPYFVDTLLTDVTDIDFDYYIPPVIPHPDKHPAVILCSSGTTGLSKAVCLSHSQLIAQITSHWAVNHDDVFVCFATLYWVSCLVSLIHGTVSGQTRVITTDVFSPDTLCEMIELYKVTTVMAPPLYVSKLLTKLESSSEDKQPDLSTIRLFLTGGAFVPDDHRVRLQKFLKFGHVVVGLGMTEMGGLCFIGRPNTKLGVVGSLCPMMQAKVVDDDGNRLTYYEHGEVCYKYSFRFLGYFGNDKANKDIIDEEGWTRSGDIGFFDTENEFHIIDRKKDIIKHMGHHIYPIEIETFLQKETGIMEICIMGVADLVDYPAALVVKPENSSITKTDIIDLVAQNFPAYKHLTGGCYFIDKLPVTPSGKVQRRLARMYATEMFKKLKSSSSI